jgi:DNA polymerase-1
MAHLSGDAGLIQAYKDGEDLHRFVGSNIFHVPTEEVTSAMRSKVKAMSYGLAYGLTSFGLSKQLEISVDEARTLMKDYFDRFGAVRDYLRGVVDQARVDGYTATIEGRRRYLPAPGKCRAYRAEQPHPGLGRGHHQTGHARRPRGAPGAGPQVPDAAAGP